MFFSVCLVQLCGCLLHSTAHTLQVSNILASFDSSPSILLRRLIVSALLSCDAHFELRPHLDSTTACTRGMHVAQKECEVCANDTDQAL